jgi:type VI secretion system secreted protein Hcp
MKSHARGLGAAGAAILLLAGAGMAAFDAFLKIDGVDGEAVEADHKDWIEISSWGMCFSGPSSAGAGGTGSYARLESFTLSKSVDKSSPQLFLHCATGEHIPEVTVELCKDSATGKVVYLQYVMKDILVSSMCPGGSSGGDRPTESLSLNFTKIEMKYWPVDASGVKGTPVIANWDLAVGKAY